MISELPSYFRLRAPGQPFIAFDPGLTRDALAYYGCAELFQVPASIPEFMIDFDFGTFEQQSLLPSI